MHKTTAHHTRHLTTLQHPNLTSCSELLIPIYTYVRIYKCAVGGTEPILFTFNACTSIDISPPIRCFKSVY